MSKLVHVEHNSQDPAAAKKFYKGLFGWKMKDMKMGDGSVYTMFESGEGIGGGLQKAPMADQPSAWLNYVGVASVKKAMAKAAKLGATVVVPFHELPGMGALGVFVDPTGAACAVWEPENPAPPVAKAVKKDAKAKEKAAKKDAKAKKKAAKKAKKPTQAGKKAQKKAAKKAINKAAKKATNKAAKKATNKAAKKATNKAAKKATSKAAPKATSKAAPKAEPTPA